MVAQIAWGIAKRVGSQHQHHPFCLLASGWVHVDALTSWISIFDGRFGASVDSQGFFFRLPFLWCPRLDSLH
jgi:hypothetical protein